MKLFIGCSSSSDIDKKYLEDCQEYLDELLRDNDLVFGADNRGLMGLAYQVALKHNKTIIGVCPEIYKSDFDNLECSEEITTKSVAERTEKAIESSDAVIFLPGGIGTIYEFFSALESKRSHEFDKPIVLYNSCGYFNQMISMLDKVYDENFTARNVESNYHVSDSALDTLNYINRDQQKEKGKVYEKR